LDGAALCHLDATCKTVLAAHKAPTSTWQLEGFRMFNGISLFATSTQRPLTASNDLKTNFEDSLTSFDEFARTSSSTADWKALCASFHDECTTTEKREQDPVDRIVCCQCRINTDKLIGNTALGIYLEVEDCGQADGLFLGVRSHMEPGVNSLMFSPARGTLQEVWLEEKWSESKFHRIRTRSAVILPSMSHSSNFSGRAGIYLYNGRVAFFRRYHNTTCDSSWETSVWADAPQWIGRGAWLQPCMGAASSRLGFHTCFTRVSMGAPPVWPKGKCIQLTTRAASQGGA